MRKIIFDLDDTLLFLSDKWMETDGGHTGVHQPNVSVKDIFFAIKKLEKESAGKCITKEFLVDYINSELSLKLDLAKFDWLLGEYAKIPLLDIDTIKDVLSYLSGKYELIAYTNWFTDNQVLRLKLNGLDQYFSEVFGWDILPTKPSEKGLEEIVGDSDVKDFVFIGDSIDMDIELPNSIGMNTIFYDRKSIAQDKYTEIENIAELKNIL